MEICHITAIHISSVEVHDHTDDMCTLQPFPYHMLWHKYDAHVESLYFYMFHICDVLFHQTFCFANLVFYLSVFFKHLSLQYSNGECILLAEIQHLQPHMTLYRA